VCINHRRRYIRMSQQLLNGAYIVTRFQQMCGKRVAKAMAAHPLRNVRLMRRFFDGLLQTTFMRMVPPRLPGAWIYRKLRTGKDVLKTGVRTQFLL
jgi:hypothetical protein